MAVFEVESWKVAEGKQEEHDRAMRGWLQWVNAHRELFGEWKSVRYFIREIAGEGSGFHFVVWEYESLAAFEAYKARRADYQGGALRRYLGERGLPLTRRFSLIGARLADRDEAAQLLMPLRMPLLSVFTLSCDAAGRPVEIALSASRSDRFQYQVAT